MMKVRDLQSPGAVKKGANQLKTPLSSWTSFLAVLWAPIILQPLLKYMSIGGCEFFFIVTWLVVLFFPYLSKTSKYYSTADVAVRPWSDNLITTSLIYFVPSVYAAIVAEYHMAFLCFVTCVGSSIYHRNREAVYFNIDNVFATSLLVSYCWSLYLSYGIYDAYYIFGLIGIPVAVFLLIYCGMPADIALLRENASPMCCVRSDRPLYNGVHAIWHLASGCGPILSVWLFSALSAEHRKVQTDGGWMIMGSAATVDHWGWLPLVPSLALFAGVLLNVTGNILGVMPMN